MRCRPMSVVGPEADSCSAAKALLFDHLVGAGEQRGRHIEADRACGLEVDRKREPRRFLKGEFDDLSAFQNAVSVLRSPSVAFHNVNTIRHKAPRLLFQTRKCALQAASATG